LYNEHTIFLHPSELEAGHPNLTLLEAISCGLPIVGTYDGTKELNSIYKIDRSTNSVVTGIKHVTSNIETFVNHTQSEKLKYDWSVICKRLLNIYNSVNDIKKEYNSELTKQLYIDVYENTNKIEHEILNDYSFNINFIKGAYIEVLGSATRHFDVEIWNDNHLDYKNKLSSGMFAKTNKQYFHNWKIKVYDGDTITIASKLPYDSSPLYRFSVRLNGIDAPEIKGKTEDEKTAAKASQKALEDLILHKNVTLENIGTEKYGRILADVFYNEINLNQWMLKNHYAIEYDGGTKKSPESWLDFQATGIVK
jgi:hypothetical protein